MRQHFAVLIMGINLALLTACGTTQPSKFYLLSPAPSGAAAALAGNEPVIGVGPVEMPKYLDRPQIVQRIGSNELKLAETHRWAEPLRNNFTQVLAENLSLMIPTRQTTLFPWTRSTRIDYQVQVIVNRFDADANGNAVLSASWKVLRKDPDEVLAMEKSTYTEAASGTDYDAIVTAQSRALAALSLEIAKVIRAGP